MLPYTVTGVTGDVAPAVFIAGDEGDAISITKEHWLSGRDRLETRIRCISAKQALTG